MSAALQTWPRCDHARTPDTTLRYRTGEERCRICHGVESEKRGQTLRGNGVWGDEAVLAELKALHAGAYSMSQIANALNRQFGISTSRSAVIGVARRLGLQRRNPAEQASGNRIKPAKVKNPHGSAKDLHARAQQRARLIIADRAPVLPSKPLPKEPAPTSGAVDILDLKPHHCRWPYGNGPFLFCGAVKAGGSSYCAAHAARAYTGFPPARKHRRAA